MDTVFAVSAMARVLAPLDGVVHRAVLNVLEERQISAVDMVNVAWKALAPAQMGTGATTAPKCVLVVHRTHVAHMAHVASGTAPVLAALDGQEAHVAQNALVVLQMHAVGMDHARRKDSVHAAKVKST